MYIYIDVYIYIYIIYKPVLLITWSTVGLMGNILNYSQRGERKVKTELKGITFPFSDLLNKKVLYWYHF